MKDIRKIDKTILVLTIMFSVLGMVMILSSSSVSTILRYHVSSNHFFIRQLLVLIVSYLIGVFILYVPTKKYRLPSYLAVILTFVLLILVLVKGKISGNAQSWFAIGPFNLQPAEFAKTIMIVFMASFYGYLMTKKVRNITFYLIPIVIAFFMALLIVKQPDLGSAAIFSLISGLIFITIPVIRFNMKRFAKILVIGGLFLAGVFFLTKDAILSEETLSRFNYKNPCTRYQEDTGYQVCNGLIAISNGGLLGRGLGKSTQKYMYLPESHTDFIFPVICEELGAIVGALILVGYGIILVKIFRIAKSAGNLRTSILAYGAFWYFALHIIINILGILALIPLTGVPLPFLSYGGSYTMNAIIIIFIVQRVAIENHKNKISREMSKLTR